MEKRTYAWAVDVFAIDDLGGAGRGQHTRPGEVWMLLKKLL
jgi:hypothetical protein